MAQYRKDVYNLAPGMGMAVDDPREGEARAREASLRADQELALRRSQAAQQQALAQREMSLSENNASFQQALAAQARGGSVGGVINAGLGAGGGGGAGGPNVPVGRDDMMRQAHAAAAMQDVLTGGQAARGMAYNTRNSTPTGSQTFTADLPFGDAWGKRPVQQASWGSAGLMLGDQSDMGMQAAIQALLGDKAKLGLEQAKFKDDAIYKQGLLGVERTKSKEDARHNLAQEELARAGLLSSQSAQFMAQDKETRDEQRDLSAEAAARLPAMFPEIGTGEIPAQGLQALQALAEEDPNLAREIARQLDTPEMQRRVGHNPLDDEISGGPGNLFPGWSENKGGYRQSSGFGPITKLSNALNWARWGSPNAARFALIQAMGMGPRGPAQTPNPYAAAMQQALTAHGLSAQPGLSTFGAQHSAGSRR